MKRRARQVRVYAIGAGFALVTAVLWARLIQVQYLRHDAYERLAKEQHVDPREIPPVRGGIFDRAGRPLALSARTCSIAIRPSEVTDRSRVASALRRVIGVSTSETRRKLRSRAGFAFVRRQVQLDDEARAALNSLDGVEVIREAGRVYPYGALASKVVGFVDVDNRGAAGAEATFEEDLRGEPGRERVIKNGRYRADRYYRHVEKKPRDGRRVYLTIDATVQEIAEDEVRRAVDTYDASSGVIIVMDVRDGDVLALAEYPAIDRRGQARVDSLWTIRSLSHVYEPGSTFKLVTASALLETHSVATADSFDAENGRASFGYMSIRDTHPHGVLSFADAFSVSSNIVFAKASRELDADEFYRFVRLFGFGTKTGVRMLGESAGTVPAVSNWSLRTQSTMAFGQEVAVTPLQMLNAMAAIANDGVMMMPRFLSAVGDGNGGVRHVAPVKIRRVVSRRTAATMRELCRRVVLDGTGTAAALDLIEVAGKTGTAQKAVGGRYLHNRFVASFVGFAPYEDPRLACLVMLDEPRWAARYGGDSAGPVFARVVRAIANATDLFDDELASDAVVLEEELRDGEPTPNFIRMGRATALEYARSIGANVLCQGESGRVVAQTPDPGVPMNRDDVVRLVVNDGGDGRGAVPDLRGMSMREARRVAAREGLRTRFVGTGIVRQQRPAPGAAAAREVVRLYGDDRIASPTGSSH